HAVRQPLDRHGEHVVVRLQRRDDHPVERQQHAGCRRDEQHVDEYPDDRVGALSGAPARDGRQQGVRRRGLQHRVHHTLLRLFTRNWTMVTTKQSTNSTTEIAEAYPKWFSWKPVW